MIRRDFWESLRTSAAVIDVKAVRNSEVKHPNKQKSYTRFQKLSNELHSGEQVIDGKKFWNY